VREDKEAELETLRNVKIFLTEKLKQNEDVTLILQKDINILKEVIRVEKQITGKTQFQLGQKERDLAELRDETVKMEAELRSQVSSLTHRNQELELKVGELAADK